MVLSSSQSHCESSPGSFGECRLSAEVAANPQTKPTDSDCESARKKWQLPSTSTIAILLLLSLRAAAEVTKWVYFWTIGVIRRHCYRRPSYLPLLDQTPQQRWASRKHPRRQIKKSQTKEAIELCGISTYQIYRDVQPTAVTVWLISPPGIAMPPAGLCFTDVTFFFNVVPVTRQRVDGSQRGLLP